MWAISISNFCEAESLPAEFRQFTAGSSVRARCEPVEFMTCTVKPMPKRVFLLSKICSHVFEWGPAHSDTLEIFREGRRVLLEVTLSLSSFRTPTKLVH
jgi:hypothetical protein